jgi:hypothetical protein
MPKQRDKERDKAETRRLILNPNRTPYERGVNWLGHGARGGKDAVIDYLLLDGATMERLLQERGTRLRCKSDRRPSFKALQQRYVQFGHRRRKSI